MVNCWLRYGSFRWTRLRLQFQRGNWAIMWLNFHIEIKERRREGRSKVKSGNSHLITQILELFNQASKNRLSIQILNQESISNNISSHCMYKLSPQKFPSCISKYTLEYLIASGTFGRVYMATSGGKKYAIKQMLEPTKVHYKQQMQNQIKVLTQMNHENIVKLYEVIRDRSYVYLVMQFCQSDLREVMSESAVGFSEEIAISIFTQIVHGMNQLVKLHIVHRDLKPANILVSKSIYKIADFGLAKYIQDECQMLKTRVGTPFYMAPQILKNQRYTSKCDIWSLGVIFFQLCFGTLPWYATSQDELLFNIYSFPLVFPKQVSNKIRKLLEGMIAIEEYQRFSWEDLIKQLITVENQPQLHVELEKSFHKSTMNKLLQIEFNRLSMASYGRKFDMLKSQEKKSIAGLIPKLFNQQSNEICGHFIRAKLKA